MRYVPHEYQSYAEAFILEHPACGLFLEMGHGKTVVALTTIDALLYDYFEVVKVLVVAPLRVAEDTWSKECEKWENLKHITIAKVLGSEKEGLQRIKECVGNNKYIISQGENRQENIRFIQEYNLNKSKQSEILLSIDISDFCHSLNNINPKFAHEILYVFCPQRTLFNVLGEDEFVDIYIKFNIIEYADNNRAIAVSFHKKNKPIDYLFR